MLPLGIHLKSFPSVFLLLELSLYIPNPSVSFCVSHSENSPSCSRSECCSVFPLREPCLSVPTPRAIPLCSYYESCASVFLLLELSLCIPIRVCFLRFPLR